MSKAIELPSLLSFDRKLETSDALMYAGNWTDIENNAATWQKIAITKRYNRSTQSAYNIDDAKNLNPIRFHPTVMMPIYRIIQTL